MFWLVVYHHNRGYHKPFLVPTVQFEIMLVVHVHIVLIFPSHALQLLF